MNCFNCGKLIKPKLFASRLYNCTDCLIIYNTMIKQIFFDCEFYCIDDLKHELSPNGANSVYYYFNDDHKIHIRYKEKHYYLIVNSSSMEEMFYAYKKFIDNMEFL